jgi:raffinose/stachyose/melibiose transport system substrate-binding protein
MLKRVISVVLSTVIVLSLITAAGCLRKETGKIQEEPAKTGESETKGGEKAKTLTLVINSDIVRDATKLVFEEFQSNTDYKLDVQMLPGGTKFAELVQAKMATKDYPDILIYNSVPWILRGIKPEENLVEITNKEYVDKVFKGIYDSAGSLNGKIYGVPFTGITAYGMVYNKDVFNELSLKVPTNYKELLEVCETIKQAGITPFYDAGKTVWPLIIANNVLWSDEMKENGAEIMGKVNQNKLSLEETGIVGVFEKQNELWEKGYFNSDLLSATYDMEVEAIATGKAAMAFQSTLSLAKFKAAFPDANISMLPIGTNKPVVCTQILASIFLPKGKNVEDAEKFIDYFTEQSTLQKYFDSMGVTSPYKGIKPKLAKGAAVMDEYVQKGELAPMWGDLLIVSYGDLGALVQDMFADVKTPEEVVKEISETFKRNAKEQNIKGF